MRLSIVIPVLNEADWIDHCLERAQALFPYEIIISDGGSTDGTVEKAQRHDCHVLSSEPGRGPQLNQGARSASGDLLLFLHVDTWLEADAKSQLDDYWRHGSHQGGAFLQEIDADGMAYRWLERGNAARARWLGLAYGDQGIFVRREAFEQLGGFPSVQIMEDVSLMRQLRRFSRLAMLPGPLHVSARRWRQHGIVRQTAKNWLMMLAFSLGVSPNRLAKFYPPSP